MPSRSFVGLLWASLAVALCMGVLDRGYWTPDEPREADIAWRMSWQPNKAVPLLAGTPFCEKPPLAYWMAAPLIAVWGPDAWAARLPNLLYALLTAGAVGLLARRSVGAIAAVAAAAAVSTLLLAYQVAIWLATDAPLLTATAVALLGLYVGFYPRNKGDRLRGYTCMHAAMACGFLSKSAAGWMVPVLTLATLILWERRWRELLRWELHAGIALQVLLIGGWVLAVYAGASGPDHLRVFFWNNLVGRFAQVAAPDELQYAAAHRNTAGKYFIELPLYLWPWTLLVAAAVRRAWQQRRAGTEFLTPVRFALATILPTLAVLSVAATARNIYLAPALPGVALLLGWWASGLPAGVDAWDRRVIRSTAALLTLAALLSAALAVILGRDAWAVLPSRSLFVVASGGGVAASLWLAVKSWRMAVLQPILALGALCLAYCALLIGPAPQIYGRVDTWQDLESVGRALDADVAGRPVVLFAPDETTRAFVDMYVREHVTTVASVAQLPSAPGTFVVGQVHGSTRSSRTLTELSTRWGLPPFGTPDATGRMPGWAAGSSLRWIRSYNVPNGRSYVLLETGGAASAPR